MTIRVIKFKETEHESVDVIAIFENACLVDTEEYPLVTFMSNDRNCEIKMVVPPNCYLSMIRDV